MGFRALLRRLPVLFGLPVVFLGRPATAQDCPYAMLRLETQQAVDAEAVCAAAQPWSEAGYQVLVWLTDARPPSEAAWFDQLDAVESEAGLRDLTQTDSFETAAIALAATTATDLPYSVTFTYGEALWDSPLDTDTDQLDAIKQNIREQLAAQDATGALSTGLTASFTLADPAIAEPAPPPATSDSPAVPSAPDPVAADTAPEQVDAAGGRLLAGGGLVVGVSGTVGILALMRQRRQRLQAQLATLQSHVANLLMGAEQLLAGGEPENTVSYQLFAEADGKRYPDLHREVTQQLGQARQVLDQAFQVHSQLQDSSVVEQQSLMQQVEAWERLYLTIVGTRDRLQQMSDEDLQTLLNPALILGTAPVSAGLTTQLQVIQAQIQNTPLKVELMQVTPDDTESEGILGLIERVDATIGRLRWSVDEAPKRLAAAHSRRQQLAPQLPDSLALSPAQVFAKIDETLREIEATLQRDRLYVTALNRCATVNTAFDQVEQLIATFHTYDDQQQAIAAITAAGYRPPELPAQQAQITTLLTTLRQQLGAGEYDQTSETLTQLAAATQTAQQSASDWQALHQQNQASIQALEQAVQALMTTAQGSAAADWAALQAYPPSNWQDLDGQLNAAQETLATLQATALPALHQHNSLTEQRFAAVEPAIEAAQQQLATVTTTLQQLSDRWQQVRQAEEHLPKELTAIEGYSSAVQQFLAQKSPGLTPITSSEERLQQVAQHLMRADNLARQREYFPAGEQRDQGFRLLLLLYLERLRDYASVVESLVNDAQARGQGRTDWQAAKALMATDADIRNATGKTLFTQYEEANQGRQKLTTAERLARQTIRRREATRRDRATRAAFNSHQSTFNSHRPASAKQSSWGVSSARSTRHHRPPTSSFLSSSAAVSFGSSRSSSSSRRSSGTKSTARRSSSFSARSTRHRRPRSSSTFKSTARTSSSSRRSSSSARRSSSTKSASRRSLSSSRGRSRRR